MLPINMKWKIVVLFGNFLVWHIGRHIHTYIRIIYYVDNLACAICHM